MARSISDEEVELKKRARRRLVGAVVLVTAVAVVLPMVLDTEPKFVSQNVNIQIPSPDSTPFTPKGSAPAAPAENAADKGSVAQPPVRPAATKPEPQAVPDPVAEKKGAAGASGEHEKAVDAPKGADIPRPAETPKAVADAPKPAETPKAAAKETKKPPVKEAAKTPAKETVKSAATGKFVVQVAALADAAKAKQLQQRVAGAGVKAYTEVVKTAKGNVTRVRAGPYATREAADKARGQLKTAGLDGKVVPR